MRSAVNGTQRPNNDPTCPVYLDPGAVTIKSKPAAERRMRRRITPVTENCIPSTLILEYPSWLVDSPPLYKAVGCGHPLHKVESPSCCSEMLVKKKLCGGPSSGPFISPQAQAQAEWYCGNRKLKLVRLEDYGTIIQIWSDKYLKMNRYNFTDSLCGFEAWKLKVLDNCQQLGTLFTTS